VVTDVCVPMSHLPAAVAAAAADIKASGLIGPMVGHVGDGNFHSQLLIMPGNAEELAAAKGIATRMAERALAVGGTITGEHGVGVGKRPLMRAQHGAAIGVMAAIKAALDPTGIMNPGKMLPDLN
jgi:D-lactate dehydrogenase (cytochrome)